MIDLLSVYPKCERGPGFGAWYAPEQEQMKTLVITAALLLPALLQAQTPVSDVSTGWPGDNFSLQGALDLFSTSRDLGSFERALNDPTNHVNNLDLNNDGTVDYIRVVDHKDGDSHAIIMEDPVSGSESQDVAVIEIEKTGATTAQARVVGDATLYGPNVSYEKTTEKSASSTAVVVDVWGWPSVRYAYGPSYVAWSSPWYWGYYPRYYLPWRPYPVHVYYGYTNRYQPYYRPARNTVYRQADVIYVGHRRSSPTVVQAPRPTNAQTRATDGRAVNTQAAPSTGQKAIAPNNQPTTKREARSVRRATRRAGRSGR